MNHSFQKNEKFWKDLIPECNSTSDWLKLNNWYCFVSKHYKNFKKTIANNNVNKDFTWQCQAYWRMIPELAWLFKKIGIRPLIKSNFRVFQDIYNIKVAFFDQ